MMHASKTIEFVGQKAVGINSVMIRIPVQSDGRLSHMITGWLPSKKVLTVHSIEASPLAGSR